MVDIMGPQSYLALDGSFDQLTPLHLFAADYADPFRVRRFGTTRITRFMHRHPHCTWSDARALAILRATNEKMALWGDDLGYGELADEIAVETRVELSMEIQEIEKRIEMMQQEPDPEVSSTHFC